MFPESLGQASTAAGSDEKWTVPARIARVELCWMGSKLTGYPLTQISERIGANHIIVRPGIYHRYVAGWPDSFWLGVMATLEQSAAWIRRCSECRKLFAIRTRRQEYCTDTCSLRGRQRKWNKVHSEEVKKRRAAAYQKALRKKHGPRVKVQSRRSPIPRGPLV
jgi:hypothetical protein